MTDREAELVRDLSRFEQQLKAYQKLHADEFAELWRTLNEYKQRVAALSGQDSNSRAGGEVEIEGGDQGRV